MNYFRAPTQKEIDNTNKYMRPALLQLEDIYFLFRCLPLTDMTVREKLMSKYRKEWLLGISQQPIEHKRQNAGRRRANGWLRVGATPKGNDGGLI